MGAIDLGDKHSCRDCGQRFYDLRRAEPTCPKCGGAPRSKALKLGGGKKAKKKKAKLELVETPTRGQGESFDDFFEDADDLFDGLPPDDSVDLDDEEEPEDD